MAEKWADFLISAVEHSESPRHIARVALRLDRGEKVGPAAEMSRPVVMAWLRARYSIATIYQGNRQDLAKGADVAIVTRDGNRISELMSIPRPKTTLAISREFELKNMSMSREVAAVGDRSLVALRHAVARGRGALAGDRRAGEVAEGGDNDAGGEWSVCEKAR